MFGFGRMQHLLCVLFSFKDTGEMKQITPFFHTRVVLAPSEVKTFLVQSATMQTVDDVQGKKKFSVIL